MPDPFITVQDLSDYLGRDMSADPAAVMVTDAACDICRSISEQDFNAGTAVESYDGTGTDAIFLAQHPVTTVGASAGTVVLNGVAISDYRITDRGMLFRGTAGWSSGGWGYGGGYFAPTWPRGRQNVQVTYQFGYTDVPRDLRMVALSIATRLVVQGAAQSETVGDVTVNYGMAADDLTANELRILNGYRTTRSF